jgi:imidazolonepropionase-like amidohydrolase
LPDPLLLHGGFVFDSGARAFVPGLDVLCVDGRIERAEARIEVSPDIRRLDCSGRFVLPGLIDCHVHLTSSGDPNQLTSGANEPLPVRAWRAAEYARKTLQAGVTTVRDLGAADRLNIHLASAIDDGLLEGPTVLAAGLGVTMTGGHGHGFIAREADGPDDVRKAVREQLRAGARAIKLFASGGVMTPGVDPRSPSLTEEEMRAGVEEAHKAFRTVAAHAQATDGIKNAVRAGVDSIEHGVWIDDEAVGLMLDHGTTLVPTLTAPYLIAYGGLPAGIPAYMVEKAHEVLADHVASYKRALAAGVKVAMGTDQGTPLSRPGENAQEVLRMAEHGLTPAAAILAATSWAARLLQIEGDCGDLRPGLRADILVLKEDPLTRLGALAEDESIAAVVKGGNVVRHTAA